ncbi:hypothetical protein [Pseudomonas sp. PLMAX]|uniref:3'-5' exonuclease n=1 Tax=Pseudomonas sp. PLMAX TaxID=2201998 RepID=UPI0038B81B86
MRPIHFIDFEASGMAPDSYPIEVAVVYPGGQFQTLLRPVPYWDHWSHDAEDMHGIGREQLFCEGRLPLEVAVEMNELFEGKTLCSDNPVDCFWLDVLYEAAGIEPTFSVQPLEAFVGREAASEILTGLPIAKAHRALGDALACATAVDSWFAHPKEQDDSLRGTETLK